MTTPLQWIEEPSRRTPVRRRTQVLVVGGGAAGVAAAVAAARSGAETILVERHGALGGLATGGLIALLLTLDDGAGHQVIGGLCQEVTERLAARGAAFFPDKTQWGSDLEALLDVQRQWGLVWGSPPHRVRYAVAYDPEALRAVLAEMVVASGVKLLLHTWACEAIRDGEHVRGVTFQSKSGRFAILADVVIDASGDGDIFASAGCAHETETVLPWLWFRVGGVDVEKAQAGGAWCFRTVNDGQVLFPWGATERVMRKIDATDPDDLTFAELECRRVVMEEFERLRSQSPGFERAHLCEIARDLGITESRRLSGRYVLARDDMDRPLDDAIGLTGHWTKYGALYWLPYRSLLAREFDNLLAAGRCISVDHRTHHATKEIPACMVTGQAAGTAAALAVRNAITPCALDVAMLRTELLAQGALLAPA
ncbi:MAG: FAD-dependent oxidoreductase [Deltaproteobacteria bacterium]|nr:FAD-dependent oxidoreductase [Deltaproteobacteria bacterium]